MDLFKEQAKEDERIFPKTPVGEFREELGHLIQGMHVEVTLLAPQFTLKPDVGSYVEVPDDYTGEGAWCRIVIEAMDLWHEETYPIEHVVAHPAHIAERMVTRWGIEFARHRFLRKYATPRVTSRQ